MKLKKIISTAAAAALFLHMVSPFTESSFVKPELTAYAVTYNSLTEAQYAQEVFRLTNVERSKVQGLSAYILSEELCQMAQVRANEIKTKFDHERPGGGYVWDMASSYGVNYTTIGENIAKGQSTPEAAMNSWMTSTHGHREAILESKYTYIGVGVVNNNGTYHWVQVFASGSGMHEADVNPKAQTKSISSCTVSLSATSFNYTGSAITPTVTVKDGSKTLTNGTDYTVTYSNNVNVGTGTVTITGKGSYSGSVSKTFSITQSVKNISRCTVTLSASSFTYTGSAIKPTVTVKDGSKTLTNGTDYTLSYTNNVNPGTGTVTITGKGSYNGSVSKTFSITQSVKNISQCTVTLSASKVTYTGGEIKPTVTVKDGSKTLTNGTDYTVTYSNNKKVGTGKVTVTGKGRYTGSVTKNFTIAANNTPFTSGDLNRDGEIDNEDIAMLQQYVSHWGVNIEIRAADVTGDGEIDTEDIATLQQYVSKWKVRLVSAL